jgi:hypothetical protein
MISAMYVLFFRKLLARGVMCNIFEKSKEPTARPARGIPDTGWKLVFPAPGDPGEGGGGTPGRGGAIRFFAPFPVVAVLGPEHALHLPKTGIPRARAPVSVGAL